MKQFSTLNTVRRCFFCRKRGEPTGEPNSPIKKVRKSGARYEVWACEHCADEAEEEA
jgi:hypothetical protein